jgi:hypothetical protein
VSSAREWWNHIKNPQSDTLPEDVLEAMHKAWKKVTGPEVCKCARCAELRRRRKVDGHGTG